ncbi:zinc-dependent peptidase [Saccharospirillum salsuginis]|uniref:Zinc-dependent peptidase n=1 Tax=Saccharospirillum salsuginis TaxID=418750 RepID=A0A918K6U4_9GAMM|nr:zinc-dependent peptidase [Saccharospirillum salsuginis]GGX52127.1 hypothetical protein GCM10007392_19320 [Saccharospirillum salsuginis]
MRKLLYRILAGWFGYTGTNPNPESSVPLNTGRDADLHRKLQSRMRLYTFLADHEQAVIRDFVRQFYEGKHVYAHPDITDVEDALLVIAANAALVGAAQKTHCFSSVKWLYLCADDLDVDGDAYESSTVRLDSDLCVEESRHPRPGENLVVHEFSHILDAQFGLSSSTPGLREGFERYVDDIQQGRWVPIADCFTDTAAIEPLFDSPDAAFHTDVEFFATASEAFFTNARELRQYNPELYADLSSIYGLDLADLDWQAIWNA